MANSEIPFQNEIIRDAKNQGYFATKIIPDFNVGLPDMFLSEAKTGQQFFEAKFRNDKDWAKNDDFRSKLRVTEIQKKKIKDLNDSGCLCRVLLGAKLKGAFLCFVVNVDEDGEYRVSKNEFLQGAVLRELGKPWDIARIASKWFGVEKH